jgi:rfaE bifunctional protein nucleotidyltransferase chain/domain
MPTADKILTLDALIEKRKEWNDQEVVFTNGCFDILHLGHVDYLEKAASKGDKLIVALNTDASVSKLKGPTRPVNKEEARARIIAALSFVDAVVFFSEDTPLSLIKQLLPDVLVKGSDYDMSNIIGADIVMENGGKVETIKLVDGYSTTNIINKINR